MNLTMVTLSLVSILLSVAFYTVMERKILSYIQIRKGPNKVGLMGVLQPFSDALKLFNKNLLATNVSNNYMFSLSPNIPMALSFLLMTIIPFYGVPSMDNKQNILFLFLISSLNVYIIILIGWVSNSKYAHLGAIRSVAQMISYELTLFLIILCVSLMSSSYYFTQISESQYYMPFMAGNLTLLCFWGTSCLAEVNRSPFDFAEGESELVSGFNVEFMGGWFAMIFLSEYSNMLILSMITLTMFFSPMNNFYSIFMLLLITFSFIWVRGTFPRLRYDILMTLNWKFILPAIIGVLPLYTIFSFCNF